jgi:hypothetical protein
MGDASHGAFQPGALLSWQRIQQVEVLRDGLQEVDRLLDFLAG